jgi:hypothetical protein
MLPNFVVIGAPKAGTTSLYHYLATHPQIFVSDPKELRFFIEEINWKKGLRWYEAQFARAGDALARGEATPEYALHPVYSGVAERIARVLPDARLIYLVRHPIERMRSQYRDRVLDRLELRPIESALRDDPQYLDGSRYAFQLEQYTRWFDPDRLLVLPTERLGDDRRGVMRRVFEFLGVDPQWWHPSIATQYRPNEDLRMWRSIFAPLAHRRHRFFLRDLYLLIPPKARDFVRLRLLMRSGPNVDTTISPELRAELTERLQEDVRRLRPLVDRDFDGWGIA